jgi:WD40 repeat protein
MAADRGPGTGHVHGQPDADAGPVHDGPGAGGVPAVDARGALGVQVGEGNFQVNYSYRLTLADENAPPPLVSVSGVIDSPYRGLRAFGERDAAFFFGREASAAELLARMSRQLRGAGLLVVSGVSGAGKSSLVQAGVLPRLRGAGLASAREAASWPCLVMTPGHAPLDELAVRVASLAGADAAQVRRGLQANPAGFALTARQAALGGADGQAGNPGGTGAWEQQPRLLLVVEQFEQLFTQCADEEQRRALITAVHAAAVASAGQAPAALVVLVVRADFEARCADYPQLAGAVQDRYLVTSMTGRQLRLAITEPAKRAGSSVDGDLVEVLLAEVSTRQPAWSRSASGPGTVSGAGVLPLLSHALDQAWRNRAGDVLTLADYERTGGIEGAVADSAERAFASLTPAQQALARQVFTRLTVTGSDGTDSADRVTRAELVAGKTAAGARDVGAVLEAFAAERLLTLAADTVEISHEVLLTAWDLLRDTWLAETRADRIVRTRLGNVAADWERSSRDRSYLYSGSLLQATAEAAARIRADPARHPPLTRAEQDFLHASNRAHRRTARRRQGLIAFLAALAVGLAAIAVTAVRSQREAVSDRSTALTGQLIAQSGSSLADINPALAKLESIAAARIASSSGQARDAMLNAAALPGIAALDDKDGPVASVAFSPDGKTLAIGDKDGTVRLWDLATGQEAGGPLKSTDAAVGSLAFSPDGKTLATGGTDGSSGFAVAVLWNVADGHQIGSPLVTDASASEVTSLAFSPDGKTLVTGPSILNVGGSGGGRAQLWDVATHRVISTITSGFIVGPVAFSPDGETIALGGVGGAGSSGTVWLWNVPAGHQAGNAITSGALSGEVTSVAFSPDGKTLAIGGTDGSGDASVVLWSVAAGRETGAPLSGGSGAVTSVAFSPDGGILATGGTDGTARLWDLATRRQTGSPLAGGGPVNSVAFSPDGSVLATGDGDGTAELWEVGAAMNPATGTPVTATGVPDDVGSVAFSPDGKTLALEEADSHSSAAVWLWSMAAGHQIGSPLTSLLGGNVARSVAFSPDGKTLAYSTGAVTDANGTVGPGMLWDVATGRLISFMPEIGSTPVSWVENDLIDSVAFSPDGNTVAVGGENDTGNGAIWLWNPSDGHQVGDAILSPPSGGVTSVAFSPDGKTLAVGGYGGTVWLWNVATGRWSGSPLSTGSRAVTSVAFSPDDKTLATGEDDGAARLWDMATRRQTGSPLAGGGPVNSVAFSPDSKTLAVGGEGTVQLWDVSSSEQIGRSFSTQGGAVTSVAFSPDGKTLAAADGDGPARLWDVGYLVNPISYLCASAARFITPAKWAENVPSVPYQSLCP